MSEEERIVHLLDHLLGEHDYVFSDRDIAEAEVYALEQVHHELHVRGEVTVAHRYRARGA